MTSKELWLKRIRNWAGFLGMILPWISLIGAVIVSIATGYLLHFGQHFQSQQHITYVLL